MSNTAGCNLSPLRCVAGVGRVHRCKKKGYRGLEDRSDHDNKEGLDLPALSLPRPDGSAVVCFSTTLFTSPRLQSHVISLVIICAIQVSMQWYSPLT